MPTMLSRSAVAPAIPSSASENELRAIEGWSHRPRQRADLGDRQTRSHFRHGPSNVGEHALRGRSLTAKREVNRTCNVGTERGKPVLAHRPVDDRGRRLIDAVVVDVARPRRSPLARIASHTGGVSLRHPRWSSMSRGAKLSDTRATFRSSRSSAQSKSRPASNGVPRV